MRPYLERRNSERFKGVNDLTFDSRGNLYFTDQGQTGLHDPTGRLYRLRPDGRLDLLLGNVPSPNGVALSPDERVLFSAVTRGNHVWRVPLLDDGSVSKVERVLHVLRAERSRRAGGGRSGPADRRQPGPGLRLGAQPPRRAGDGAAQRAGMSLTNVAFGGTERKTLYCTESISGSVLRGDLDVPGMQLHRARAVR